MHILGIIGSMRKNRHTHALVTHVIREMQALAPGLESDVVYIADQTIHPVAWRAPLIARRTSTSAQRRTTLPPFSTG